MPLIHNNHMVEQIAAAVADPALGNAVLPQTAEAGPLRLNTEALYCFDHFVIELRSAIKNQVTRCRVIRKRLAQLLHHPGAGRVFGYIALKDAPTIMCNDEEAIQHAKSKRWHGEEVHSCNRFSMIIQKSRPSLRLLRISRCLSHPSQHRSLRNIETKHLQFTVDARRAPGGVFGNHAKDQFAQLLADAFSSYSVQMPRKTRPIQLEPCPMPANNGLRLDKNQRPLPSRPKLPQHHPEQFIRRGKSRLRMLLLQYCKLLAKG